MLTKARLGLGLVLIALILISALILDYLAIWPFANVNSGQPVYLNGAQDENETSLAADPLLPTSQFAIVEASNIAYKTEAFVEGLAVPWSVVFTSPERILVTERTGRIREIIGGELQNEPLYEFTEITARGEAGLMGLVLDPNYATNRYLYVCYATTPAGTMMARVARFTDTGEGLSDSMIVVDNIPAANNHAGCELGFGPDGKLYITTGDASNREIAQDLGNLGGKILRVNADGSVPDDNPFSGSRVWSYGHRNPQGIAWYPGSEALYSSEHGPSGFDGPGGGDEINLIKPGENYGWPRVSHQNSAQGMVDPLVVFTPAIAPASVLFYDSEHIPEFRYNLFAGLLVGEGIMRFVINPENPEEILMYEKLPLDDFGRIRELVMGPDGHLYFATSNQDGRGNVRSGDDKIVRIIPQ